MGKIAEGVLMGGEPGIGRDIDAPAHHVLPLVVARREPQHLDDAGSRRVVVVDVAMRDAQAHVGTAE